MMMRQINETKRSSTKSVFSTCGNKEKIIVVTVKMKRDKMNKRKSYACILDGCEIIQFDSKQLGALTFFSHLQTEIVFHYTQTNTNIFNCQA